jgi:hypothetical protein
VGPVLLHRQHPRIEHGGGGVADKQGVAPALERTRRLVHVPWESRGKSGQAKLFRYLNDLIATETPNLGKT